MKSNAYLLVCSVLSVLLMAACSKSSSSSASEDSSASGAAASSVGGAIAASDSSSTVSSYKNKNLFNFIVPTALASTACPTVVSGGAGCASNGNPVDLTYSSCSFGSSAATWTGTLEVSLINNGAITCGTFPDRVASRLADNDGILRQFVIGGNPGSATRTNSRGTVVTIDHATANLGNFDTGTAITANVGTGYGTKVVFDGSGHRKQVQVRQRIYSSVFDHSINADVLLSESAGTRTITSGTVKVYHNKLRVVGTSTFTNVVYNTQCCNPISGSIATSFAAGAHVSPTVLGSLAVGKSESLTFTGCGTATFVNTSGASSDVTLNNCF